MMNSRVQVKICGITNREAWQHCVEHGVEYLGMMFYRDSPRNLSISQAKTLSAIPRKNSKTVAVCVNPTDDELLRIATEVQPDMWQFHGNETPERLCNIYQIYAIPIIKSFPIAEANDFAASADYAHSAEYFLFDAKPRAGDPLPGGNAHAFNWSLLPEQKITRAWFLAGGLSPDNITEALRLSGARAIDISSGVEETRGIKSIAKIDLLLHKLVHFSPCRD